VGTEGGGTRDVPGIGGVEGLPKEESCEGKTVMVDFVGSAIYTGRGSPTNEELGCDGGGVRAGVEWEGGSAGGVGEIVVEQRARRGPFIRFFNPNFFPALEELLFDLDRIRKERAICLPETWGTGGTVKQGAAGGELGGNGLSPSRGEMLMGQCLVGLRRFGLVKDEGEPGGGSGRGDAFRGQITAPRGVP
jgi:hypothetical protein